MGAASDSHSLIKEVIKLFGVLGLLVCLYISILRYKKKFSRTKGLLGSLYVENSLFLGGNRLLLEVRWKGCRLLLGVTDNSINLLKELPYTEEQMAESNLIETDCPKNFIDEIKSALFGPKTFILAALFLGISLLFYPNLALAAPETPLLPGIEISVDRAGDLGALGNSLGILGILTVLAISPSILIMTTSFTRISIVFSFLRAGMGTGQSPPNQVLVGLALLITFFIMTPTWGSVNEVALTPYLEGEIDWLQAFYRASVPMKEFMLKVTREKDLALFMGTDEGGAQSPQDLSLFQVAPAFAISELRTAFEMGFLLYLPFLVVDMVVASILMSMGMLMLPPILISLPFKILLFVLVDGWGLITKSLILGFR